MRRLKLVLALGAVALLALSGIAMAQDRHGDDNGGHDHHGRHHHHEFQLREAGTISSFDATTGKLTIALTGGESVTGLVTDGTRISCEGVDDRRDHGGDHHGGQNEPGDDSGGEVPAGEASCTVGSLTPGAVVGEAELRLEGGGAVFEEVELGIDS